MPQKQKRFTKEFEEEAVQLVRTSGHTKGEIAEDLGVNGGAKLGQRGGVKVGQWHGSDVRAAMRGAMA